MANKNLVLRLLITAKDEASGILSSMQTKMAGIAAAIAGYFGFSLFSGAIQDAGNFEAAMSRVKAATGAAGEELQALKKAAEDAGANTQFTSVQAAAGLENLAKAGLTAKQAITALPAVLALAEAGDVSLAESATYVTRTVAGMGVAVEEAGRIADVLAMGANASNTSVKGLAEALSYAAPTARSLGLSLEQTVAYIGKFADAGIDASRAGTALNAILAQFQDPASKFRKELTDAGIITGNFDKALRELAASGAKGEKAILAVGTEAGPALRGLLNQGIGALDALKGKLDDAKGSAASTAATMGSNLNGALKGLSSAWDTLKIKLGEPVLGAVTEGVKELTTNLQAAVSNGTVAKFGEAFRNAFASAAEWARRFAGEIDPAAWVASLQRAADKVGAWFDEMSARAKSAGDIVRTAYGVMSSGANIVMASVFKISEAFAGVASNILSGVALINDGLAKVTFGRVSEGFKAAADEIRLAAGGMSAVSQEYAAQASKAFDAAAEGAEMARKGWAGLTAPAEQAQAAAGKLAEAARFTADDLDKAGEGAVVLGGKLIELGAKADASASAQKTAAAAAAEKVKELRAEYDKLIAAGKTDEAAKKLLEVNAALREASGNAKSAADEMLLYQHALTEASAAAERHVAAERVAGSLAQQALQNDRYRAETILAVAKQRGNEKDVAEAQIEVWKIELQMNEVQAEAARLEAEAMALVVKAKRAELEATGDLTEAKKAELALAEANVKAKLLEAEKYELIADRMQALNYETRELQSGLSDLSAAADSAAEAADRAAGSYEGLSGAIRRAGAAQSGFTAGPDGNALSVAVPTEKSVAERLKELGLDDATAAQVARQFFDGNGNVQNTYGRSLDDAVRAEADRRNGPLQSSGPSQVVRVRLESKAGVNVVDVVDKASAERLVKALQDAGMSLA